MLLSIVFILIVIIYKNNGVINNADAKLLTVNHTLLSMSLELHWTLNHQIYICSGNSKMFSLDFSFPLLPHDCSLQRCMCKTKHVYIIYVIYRVEADKEAER